MIWRIKTYIIAYAKIQKNEDILSIMSNVEPNCSLNVDSQKVDQHAGGKWLIHDTKRRNDNQLQSLKYIYIYGQAFDYVWHIASHVNIVDSWMIVMIYIGLFYDALLELDTEIDMVHCKYMTVAEFKHGITQL